MPYAVELFSVTISGLLILASTARYEKMKRSPTFVTLCMLHASSGNSSAEDLCDSRQVRTTFNYDRYLEHRTLAVDSARYSYATSTGSKHLTRTSPAYAPLCVTGIQSNARGHHPVVAS